jgi:Flp pilus assembly protein TadD
MGGNPQGPTGIEPEPGSLRDRAVRLALEGRYAEAEVCAREALRLRPGDVATMNELGVAIWKQGREAEAEAIYREACAIEPDDFRTWTNLGLSLSSQFRSDEAEACFREALRIHPKVFHAQMGLGNALSNRGEYEAATAWLESALAMCPDSVDALHNVAVNLVRQGRWAEAVDYYERAIAIDPTPPDLRRNYGYALLATGDYERGWPEHEWRLNCLPHPGVKINRTFWNGDRFPDRTILLHFEQGYGDVLQFIRYAPMVKRRGGRVAVLCQPALVRLLSRCEGVDLVCDGRGFEPACHIQVPLMSLPAIFGTTIETIPSQFPYLHPDPAQVEHWRTVMARLDEAAGGVRPFRIGVVWQGRPEHKADHWRSFSIERFGPIAAIPGVELVSLQAEHGTEQLAALNGRIPIVELPGRRARDFSETAAIASQLDLIVAPCTAVAHLAGGLGVPVWVAMSYTADWRWMADREDTPWYPTMRLFRQSSIGDWDGVFRRIGEELRALLARCPGALTLPADAA